MSDFEKRISNILRILIAIFMLIFMILFITDMENENQKLNSAKSDLLAVRCNIMAHGWRIDLHQIPPEELSILQEECKL